MNPRLKQTTLRHACRVHVTSRLRGENGMARNCDSRFERRYGCVHAHRSCKSVCGPVDGSLIARVARLAHVGFKCNERRHGVFGIGQWKGEARVEEGTDTVDSGTNGVALVLVLAVAPWIRIPSL